jgi:hypothetical protein
LSATDSPAYGSTINQTPSRGKCLANVPRGADRITHVVQAVEGRHQAVVSTDEMLRSRNRELGSVGETLLRRLFAGQLDRPLVGIEAGDIGGGIRGGQDPAGGAETATDIGDRDASG